MRRLLALWILATTAQAHEMRPSRLAVEPAGDGTAEVTWVVGLARGRPMPLSLVLPERCTATRPKAVVESATAVTERWQIECGARGLAGATLRVEGLERTGTDVVADVGGHRFVLDARTPSLRVPDADAEARTASAWAFLPIGVEHILLGPDHLLFVLGLLLVVGHRWRTLLATITAFTLAHSITLGLAATGTVVVAQRAVEATIALSILVLARELLPDRGEAGTTLATRAPWVFALVCGLLHGFGFAGALVGVGLPDGQLLGAVLLFNLGVEIGQLAFVFAMLLVGRALRELRWARPMVAYAMGSVAAFWLLDRVVPILRDFGGM